MQTLYRKYRPKKFDEVIGQDHVISILKNSLKSDSISHAYIFAGSRGTGKTSVARIFSDALGTTQNDTYEIDAASNRGIDDIRAIRDAVNTLPFESRFKVYIVDEAHMLTKEAWNALLKTLEEPPAHVIFILATTEIEKIPETILSRCETYTFKRPTEAILSEVISKTAKKEGFGIDSDATLLIASLADGSFRDAHGTLQKAIGTSSKDKKITREEIEKITGAPKISLVEDFVSAISDRDARAGLEVLNKVSNQNLDMQMFAKLSLESMRRISLFKITGKLDGELSEKRIVFVKKVASNPESKINSDTLREFLKAYEEIKMSTIPELPLELALIKIIEK